MKSTIILSCWAALAVVAAFGCQGDPSGGHDPLAPGAGDKSAGGGNAMGGTASLGTGSTTNVGGSQIGGASGTDGFGAGSGGVSSGGAPVGGAPSGGVSSGGAGGGCADGQLACGSSCVAVASDNANCGACAVACSSGESCQGGVCQCTGGLADCGGSCVNTASDAANCGMCGVACSGGQFCSAGVCSTMCGAGQTACGSSCVDLTSDVSNCGMCGRSCPSGQTCSAGACACSSGLTACGQPVQCVNTATSSANCGSCGNACPSGRSCSNGQCVCAAGQSDCNGTCVNTQTDASHCGTCNNACMNGAMCASGTCSGGVMCTADNTSYNGRTTNYTLATSMVACHYPTSTLPQYYGAMNEQQYASASICGACVEVRNNDNGRTLTVTIVDECPYEPPNLDWCGPGSNHIDLNVPAKDFLDSGNNPAITWRFVPCPSTSNIRYYIDPASHEYYLAVTPMNHRYRISKVEVQSEGTYRALTRNSANMWELSSVLIPNPINLRVTDIHNHVVQHTIAFQAGATLDGNSQFPTCN